MSRTSIFNWIVLVLGGLGLVGIDMPVDQIMSLLDRIVSDSIELYMVITGAVGLWLRKVTDSPLADGIRGWLGLR